MVLLVKCLNSLSEDSLDLFLSVFGWVCAFLCINIHGCLHLYDEIWYLWFNIIDYGLLLEFVYLTSSSSLFLSSLSPYLLLLLSYSPPFLITSSLYPSSSYSPPSLLLLLLCLLLLFLPPLPYLPPNLPPSTNISGMRVGQRGSLAVSLGSLGWVSKPCDLVS